MEVPETEFKPISTDGAVKEVESIFDKVKPILVSVSQPIADAWEEINQDMGVESAEEENLYVTQAKTGANLSVKLILSLRSHCPQESSQGHCQ